MRAAAGRHGAAPRTTPPARRVVLTLTGDELTRLEHAAVDAGHGARLGAYVTAVLRAMLEGRQDSNRERAAAVTRR